MRISGVRGDPPPATTKVALNYQGGFRSTTTLYLAGLDIEEKAALVRDGRCGRRCQEAGTPSLRSRCRCCAPTNRTRPPTRRRSPSCGSPSRIPTSARSAGPSSGASPNWPWRPTRGSSVVVRPRARPPTGFTGRRSYPPRWCGRRWWWGWPPAASDRWWSRCSLPIRRSSPTCRHHATAVEGLGGAATTRVPLGRLAGARSGDKGGNANLGVWARTDQAYRWLAAFLTVERLQELLPETAALQVDVTICPTARPQLRDRRSARRRGRRQHPPRTRRPRASASGCGPASSTSPRTSCRERSHRRVSQSLPGRRRGRHLDDGPAGQPQRPDPGLAGRPRRRPGRRRRRPGRAGGGADPHRSGVLRRSGPIRRARRRSPASGWRRSWPPSRTRPKPIVARSAVTAWAAASAWPPPATCPSRPKRRASGSPRSASAWRPPSSRSCACRSCGERMPWSCSSPVSGISGPGGPGRLINRAVPDADLDSDVAGLTAQLCGRRAVGPGRRQAAGLRRPGARPGGRLRPDRPLSPERCSRPRRRPRVWPRFGKTAPFVGAVVAGLEVAGQLPERSVAVARRFPGQAEHPLGQDVVLDLVGAAGDRLGRAPTPAPR